MPAVTSYTAGAPSSFPTVSVTPTASHPSATIQVKINGGSFAGTPSGTPSASLSLDDPMGSNLLSVRVTAEDGTTTKDYSVVISKTVAVTVMADPNGTVLFDSMPPGTYEKTPGAALPIVATPNPGYSFNNWTGTANVSVPTAPSTTLTVGVTDSTATANHMPNNYIVTFDEQGGTPSAPATNSVTFGTPYSLMATTNRTGYTFGGWWTLPGGGGVEVNGGTIVTQTANHTVYAKWTINQYTVTYMANGATLGTVPGAQLDDFGATVTVAPNSGKLVGAVIQDGIRQRFLQWNTDAAGTGTNYSPGGSLVLGAANVTLYAQFSIDGSAIGKVGPAGGFVFHDKGSVSNGWRYLEAAPVNQASSVWSNVNAAAMGGAGTAIGTGAFNSILTMKQAGHASSAAQVCDAYSTTYDSIVYDDWFLPSKDEVNAAHSNLSATDFDIGAYWSSSETAATSAYCPSQASPAHNTLKEYAYPVRAVRAFAGPAPLYVIQYFANGADTGTPLGDPSFYPAGAAVNIGGVNDMIKSTYDFGGWNTEANGSGTDYPTGGATMPAGNLVLFAVWNPM
jgi:uncharacterized repeat protein (TIGR02543 family)